MLRSHLPESHGSGGEDGFGALLEFLLHLGPRISHPRRLNDHGIECSPASERGNLPGKLCRCGREALDVEPAGVGQRERRRHKDDLREIFNRHRINGRLHRAGNVRFVQMRVHIDIRTERGHSSLGHGRVLALRRRISRIAALRSEYAYQHRFRQYEAED